MSRNLRVAVVGSGPAGLYAVEHLLERLGLAVEIDLYERLPTPWGLVRGGVAPDHPDKKRVVDNLFDYYFRRPQLRFFGNVEVGREVRADELATWYDAVIYAIGASGDLPMGIPGEDLPGIRAAREFVAWYNGHPDFRDAAFDLSSERAVVIGNGNVALDVARMLTLPTDVLARTDIADHALEALRGSRVREVVVLGRRGHLQAAFSCAELEELAALDDVAVEVQSDGFPRDDSALPELPDWNEQRKLRILARLAHRRIANPRKRLVFRFLASPVDASGDGRVERLRIATNRLEADANGRPVPVPTGEVSTLDTGIVLRAIGYRGLALAGLPFDARSGTVANADGRVLDEGRPVPGVYVAGWVKRGARGIIGTNRKCARDTVHHLLADHADGRLSAASLDAGGVLRELGQRQLQVVDRDGWFRVDRAERVAGGQQQRPRVKITDRDALLRAARS